MEGESKKYLRKDREPMKRSYSVENGYPGKTRSLVGDAKFEKLVRRESRMSFFQHDSETDDIQEVTEDEAVLLESLQDEAANSKITLSLLIRLSNSLLGMENVIQSVQFLDGNLIHLETREPRGDENNGITLEILITIDLVKDRILQLVSRIRGKEHIKDVKAVGCKRATVKGCWFPRHISDLDNCNHILTKMEPELDMNHPGWSDKEYRARRKMIADVSFNYKHGEKIPRIDYTKDEIATWDAVYSKVFELLPGRASTVHRKYLQLMEKECGFGLGKIPQLEDVSCFLKKSSGFSLRPAAGLLTARDFLASLAFRVFQCTQYVRHHTSPHYSPEPDVLHELIGHAPIFADPGFAQFSQEIGLASLGASDEEIEKLATVYWFTVEFGLCKEDGDVRAYGAGLLSSYGELLHSLSRKPSIEYRPFDPASASVQEYDDQAYQDIYYIAESFEDAKAKLRVWIHNNLSRQFTVRYLPFTQSVEIVDTLDTAADMIQEMQLQVNQLSTAFHQIAVK